MRSSAPPARRAARTASLVLAGSALTTLGVVLPAGSASAASSADWDRLAQCESSGNWAANTGNGFYGGLQFTQSTWQGYGGAAYASRADLASASEQKVIADRVLASQGWGAWPACSQATGLAGSSTSGAPTYSPPPSAPVAAAPAPAATSVSLPAFAPVAVTDSGKTYTVRRGDSLSAIAARLRLRSGWPGLFTLNHKKIGDNPDLIEPGQRLALPTH